MTTPHHRAQLKGRLKVVQDTQRRISGKIRAIQAQLKKFQNVPESQPWISFGRVHRIEDLKSAFPDLRSALRHDLLILKNAMRALKVSEKNLRTAMTRKRALQNSRDFKKRLAKVLKEAEKNGELDDKDLNLRHHNKQGFFSK